MGKGIIAGIASAAAVSASLLLAGQAQAGQHEAPSLTKYQLMAACVNSDMFTIDGATYQCVKVQNMLPTWVHATLCPQAAIKQYHTTGNHCVVLNFQRSSELLVRRQGGPVQPHWS